MIFNWIDVVFGCVIARFIYLGRRSELIFEIYKLVTIYFATIIGLHYYKGLGVFFSNNYILKDNLLFPTRLHDFFAFTLIIIGISLLFHIIKEGWMQILKVQSPNILNKWGSIALSIVNSYIFCGLIVIALLLSDNALIMKETRRSISGGYVFKFTSLSLYENFYKGFISKFFKSEFHNQAVYDLVLGSKGKK